MSKILKDKKANGTRIGVFLCECGGKINTRVDLQALEQRVRENDPVSHVETLPYPCLNPGLCRIRAAIAEMGLNRVVVAGCENRIMLKKFEERLEEASIEKGEIDMVNLRDHVASAGDGDPLQRAERGAKLLAAAVAGLKALISSPKTRIEFNGPVMILGGGVATFSAAQELLRQGIETLITVQTDEIEDEIRLLHERYPGERANHRRLVKIMQEVEQSPLVKRLMVGELDKVMGVMGDYTVTFTSENGRPPMIFHVGALIAALDGEMRNQGNDFGHDGKRVICHTEMEEHIWCHGVPDHRVVFWVNDLETDRPYAQLSARTAWNMAQYMRSKNVITKLSILYNNTIDLPLSTPERTRASARDIRLIPYDATIRPTIQSGYITFCEPEHRIERELGWDQLVLSPKRHPGLEQIQIAKILGFPVRGEEFLERNAQNVRPEQVGLDEKFLAGSARWPCDLREALRQGRHAAKNIAEIILKAKGGKLYAPRMVCSVDSAKCTGCGLCREICDCGGIAPVEGPGGGIPRVVDPMVCTGGGTCAAACPYQALVLQNNSTQQREARVATLARSLKEGEVMAIGCNWGGTAAADHAGLRGLKHDERFYLLSVDCIGQLDATVMGRAFLEGANGLLLIGCPPEECHHSYGLDHTWSRVLMIKKLLSLIGLERERIALAHADLNNPEAYVKTVNRFVADMEGLGPIKKDDPLRLKIRDLYDTLKNPRVRWVLGASLRRPWETTYPTDLRNAMAYDETLSDVLAEEFVRTRIVNLLKGQSAAFELNEITTFLGEDKQKVVSCLSDLAREGIVSRIFKDRAPLYSMG